MEAQRISLKLYVDGASKAAPHDFVPVFHAWIRSRALDEVLVDVADYTHVHEGPGILLVCHAANYGLDLGEGRPGLVFTRKRDVSGTWPERIRSAFRSLLAAARKLELEPSLEGKLRFSTSEVLFRINDRLHAPNTPETFAVVEPDLRAVAARVFGAAVELAPSGAADELFGVRIRASSEAPVAQLLERA